MAEQKHSASRALPKNIRQIGTSTGSTRIYLEDYVYTYLHTQEEQEEWRHRGFALIGRMEREKDYVRYFISGMICLHDSFFKNGILEFSDDTWAFIYQEMKKYYDNLDIVGWGQDAGGISAGMITEIERSHKQNFNIQKNILFLLDTVENDEAFYIFEKNILQRREGYYVYYEKNPQMQEYMIQMRKSRELDVSTNEIKEPLVRSYRETLIDRKEQITARKWNGVLYTTSMLLVLSVCVLGVSTVNNVEKMQNLESRVSRISGQGGQAGVSPAMSQDVHQQETSSSDLQNSGSNDSDKAAGENGTATESDPKESDKNGQTTETDSKESDKNGKAMDSDSEKSDKNRADADNDQASSGKNETTVDENKTGAKADEKTDGKNQSAISTSKNTDKNNKEKKADSTNHGDDADSIGTAALNEVQTSLLQGYYIVKKGDSLVGISKKIYGTAKKAQTICDLNGIDDMDKIYAGQKLELP